MTRDQILVEMIEGQYNVKGIAKKSFLRQEIVLSNSSNQYTVDFNGNVQNTPKTERRLSIQNTFFTNKLGLFLVKEDVNKIGSAVLLAHPDAAVFGAKAANLEVIYNGLMKATIDNKIVFEALQTSDFRKNPAQFMPEDGKLNLDPTIILKGNKRNELSLTFPYWNNMAVEDDAAGTTFRHKLIVMAYGFEVSNVN